MSPRRPGLDPSKQRSVDPLSLEGAMRRFASVRPLLVVLDFDGTLAPLVDDPADSRMTVAARSALRGLLAVPGVRLALLSGRGLDDLRARAQAPRGTVLVASHGAEVEGADTAMEASQRALLEHLRTRLAELSSHHPGTHVETKPTGVVLHTRQATSRTAARVTADAMKELGGREGVHVRRGKDVLELQVVEADKGSALDALRAQLEPAAVLFAGDDVTDEDAFRRLWPSGGDVGVKVGPGETAAEFRVDTPQDLAELLADLADLLHD